MEMQVQELLNRIQQGIEVPKGRMNKFGGFRYRKAEDILSAVKPFLADGGTVTLSDEIVQVGSWIFLKATAVLWLGTESIFCCAFARLVEEKKGMDAAQVTGAASSYARKYALMGLFGISDGEDADDLAAAPAPVAPVSMQTMQTMQIPVGMPGLPPMGK